MDRRDFLKLAGLCGLSVAVPFKARAQSNILYENQTYFVQVNAGGGWDPTSLCDPKGSVSVDEQENGNPMNRAFLRDDIATTSQGQIRYAPVGAIAPAIPAFFERWQNDLLVINGVDTQTNGHDSGSRHVWSGKLADGHPSWGALVASAKSRQSPMAFISNGGFDITRGLVAPTRSGNINVLQRVAFPNRFNPGDANRQFHTEATQARIAAAQRARSEALQQQTRLQRVRSAMSTLYTARVGENDLRRLTDFLPDDLDNSGNALRRQAQLAVASFKAGLSVSANLSIGGFDTHGNHDANHIPRLGMICEGVDFLLDEADRQGVDVVVAVGSDFGRTPRYNDGNGKDHWSITSMMLIGSGIRGGRTIGETDDGHRALNVDPSTLQTVAPDTGTRLEPGHVHLALRELAGISDDEVSRQFPVNLERLDLFS